MHYHTSEKEFYVDGCLSPEPKELLEQLEAMYAAACAEDLTKMMRRVSARVWHDLTYAAISMHWGGR